MDQRPSLTIPRRVLGVALCLGLAVASAARPASAVATTAGTAAAAARPLGATTRDPVGRWPLQPRPTVVHRFDPPAWTWGRGHRGVDLAGRIGQPVRAALPGTVSFTGRIAGVRIVVVDHGTTRTTYQPVGASLPRGTEVTAGQVIGHLEWYGTHCSPSACLHWGWIRGTVYLDPLSLLGALGVRLLPLDHPLGLLGALRARLLPPDHPPAAAPTPTGPPADARPPLPAPLPRAGLPFLP